MSAHEVYTRSGGNRLAGSYYIVRLIKWARLKDITAHRKLEGADAQLIREAGIFCSRQHRTNTPHTRANDCTRVGLDPRARPEPCQRSSARGGGDPDRVAAGGPCAEGTRLRSSEIKELPFTSKAARQAVHKEPKKQKKQPTPLQMTHDGICEDTRAEFSGSTAALS